MWTIEGYDGHKIVLSKTISGEMLHETGARDLLHRLVATCLEPEEVIERFAMPRQSAWVQKEVGPNDSPDDIRLHTTEGTRLHFTAVYREP